MVCVVRVVLLFVLVDITVAAIFNGSFLDTLDNELKDLHVNTRRARKKRSRSTSSSSGEPRSQKLSAQKESLGLTGSDSSESGFVKKPEKKSYAPKSSRERRGWKKWHRKCTPCPEDMRLKWRDPRIKWICGSYQRARRSFKSLCMMHYRNCQDGTMFTKMADHRCQNTTDLLDQGEHFLYDYSVDGSDDSAQSKTASVDDSSSQMSASSESWNSDKHGSRPKGDGQHKNEINVLKKET